MPSPTEAEVRSAFAAFDTDGNGLISPHELRAILTRPFAGQPAMLTDRDVDELLRQFDADGDGVLSVEEFARALAGLTEADQGVLTQLSKDPDAAADEAVAMLQAMDMDRDGETTADELRLHLLSRGKTEGEVAILIQSIDQDGDGKIGLAELRKGLLRSSEGLPDIKMLLAAAPDASGVDFSDLAWEPGTCFRIPNTERRAVTLEQLRRIVAHCARRLGYVYKEPVVGESYTDKHGNAYCPVLELGRWELGNTDGEQWLGIRPKDGKLCAPRRT
jgi:Ca2+-binding EF-hand superfamily protein